MITDPYKVLGISSSASDDEVKRAYRELSRKYHPDSYIDNPLSDLAEEKFKEVQEAYDQIINDRQRGSYSSSSSGYSSSSANQRTYSRSSYGETDPQFQNIAEFINQRRYYDALNSLSTIPYKSAKWCYYNALANTGIGNNIAAVNSARRAVELEPANQTYRNLLNQMQWSSNSYQQNSRPYNNNSECGTGNFCCDLWCADTLCECMGGDLCSCM